MWNICHYSAMHVTVLQISAMISLQIPILLTTRNSFDGIIFDACLALLSKRLVALVNQKDLHPMRLETRKLNQKR